ncbi:glycosyltransferase [Fictibacillus barbaricus]|uniref:Spore maturation protein CgeB n=1 Tax=Fictibacillus barbaricus TaxID=182136 RepID=A0ABU1TXV4_9BACL|nr:glycosyltransferase [Fictibacillus barbaricus]MDR7072044.1 spore maturation protein CgeB [Fictibacillus barbaricus]
MEKINLLFITKNRSNHLERSTWYLAEELSKRTNLVTWSANGSIHDILANIPFSPDFILINDYHPEYSPRIYGLHSVSIPKGMIMHEIHYKKFHRKKFIENENIQLVFTHYRDAFLKWYPELAARMVWFPHFIHPEIFKDYGAPKTINYLMIGAAFPHLYPVRNNFMQQLIKEPGFVSYHHPGYGLVTTSSGMQGVNYAMEINRAKMFFTCDSNYGYPVLKYFEVLACNTLLIASASKELADLGFVDGVTYIAADPSDVIEKARYYNSNETIRKKIAYQGHQMVMNFHTIEVRVGELLQKIKAII